MSEAGENASQEAPDPEPQAGHDQLHELDIRRVGAHDYALGYYHCSYPIIVFEPLSNDGESSRILKAPFSSGADRFQPYN